jgi:hypothetical protein
MMMRKPITALTVAIAAWAVPIARAQAHFNPGVANIRDYAVPEPGLYLAVYNYDYQTSDLTDNNGNKVSQVILGPPNGPNFPVNVKVDANIYALSPLILWITPWKFLGAQYGAYIGPAFSNSNVGAALSTLDGQGINPNTSQFAAADLFVQPLWLGWNRKHFDVAAGYGFYAPVGKFNYQTKDFSIIGERTFTAADNTGLGYWTHQLQGNVTWYPNPNRGLAVSNTLTGEINGKQEGTGVTSGDYLTWNWGASKYIPVEKPVPRHLVEAGLTGYSEWQITDTTGPNVSNPGYHHQVHGIGGQIGVIFVAQSLELNFRYLHEYYSENRLQGNSYGLNLGVTLKKPKPAAPQAPPPPAVPAPAPAPPAGS